MTHSRTRAARWSRAPVVAFGGVLVVGAASAAACGGNESGVRDAKLPQGVRSEGIEHEQCNESANRVETLDANGDGKPDIRRVYDKSGHEICRITDLNHDGKPDMFEYYDANGQLRRREADFDDSGVVDAVEYYDGGKLVRRELDTTGQHRIDTWDYFDPATGKRTKRERDTTNDGRVDQWWTYDGDKVTIAIDKNGDGQPEPDQTIVIGGGGADAKDAGAATNAADGASPTASADAGATTTPSSTPSPVAGPTTDAGAADGGPPKRKENRGGAKK